MGQATKALGAGGQDRAIARPSTDLQSFHKRKATLEMTEMQLASALTEPS